ncbi:MarR family transcriptional regulator [Chitiniphilus purpureus]|uniref:MarR family transcriptional regulator n=1 Tax=Chitiniphilus purpureus TaxID=2981137 RepID=A0ABY6DK72_9NEIS|nr:MarR family transcriptional regulator [Chitiniphilus sp. CD1]UXY14760.1 MarR family transcriptional regulator [Chitiniphilus sp. CD1]
MRALAYLADYQGDCITSYGAANHPGGTMDVAQINTLLLDTDISGARTLRVALAIVELGGHQRPIEQKAVADRLGMQQTHVSNAVAELKRHGILTVTECEDGRLYEFRSAAEQLPQKVSALTTDGKSPLTVGGNSMVALTVHGIPQTVSLTVDGNSLAVSGASLPLALSPHTPHTHTPTHEGKPTPTPQPPAATPDGFAEFWDAYPKKVAKDAARKRWEKLKPDAELQAQILSALAVQSRLPDWLKQGGQFVPHAATWLNAKRWEDEVKQPGAAKPVCRPSYDDGQRRDYGQGGLL